MIKGFNSYKNKFGIHTSEEIHLGLERIKEFLHAIGDPQNDLKSIHIAGTNGKGSTVQFMRQILMEAGYKVGTFTSPAILQVNDQICTNEGPISVERFDETLQYIISHIQGPSKLETLTDFELLTVVALVYFSRIEPQDAVVFETGMGGLTDSTNVLCPLVSIITNISLEHTAFLGNTLGEIAYQKAGIIKPNTPSITGVQNQEALSVIKNYAKKLQSDLYVLNEDFSLVENGHHFDIVTNRSSYKHLRLKMKGRHQQENSSLAVKAAEILNSRGHFKLEVDQIIKGLQKASMPGRFEMISENPTIILDGAHNPDAVKRLVETLKEEYPNRKVSFLFGALKDKNTRSMLSMLEPIASDFIFVDFPNPRAASAQDLAEICTLSNKKVISNLQEALIEANNRTKIEGILVITGSLYLLSEVKENLKNITN
ncbi:bifunctional folylpolyglutamate synthase/dihydrofolate synthase [Neobacillus sp. Marseille-QA0830]